jgi:sulfur carrier protein ThiS
MRGDLMRIKLIRIGNVTEMEFRDGGTVAELLCRLGHYDDDDVFVSINQQQAFPDQELSEGNEVAVFFPIRGAAPLPPGHISESIRQLRKFTSGATELILIDPYILKPRNGEPESSYVNALVNCVDLPSAALRQLHIIYSWWHHNRSVLHRLSERCVHHGCGLTYKHDGTIHDRVWIKDRKKAIAVGGSFNTVGGRLTFVLDLPESDLEFLMEFLQRGRLI